MNSFQILNYIATEDWYFQAITEDTHSIHIPVLTVLTHKLFSYRKAFFFSLWLRLQIIFYQTALILHLSLFAWNISLSCKMLYLLKGWKEDFLKDWRKKIIINLLLFLSESFSPFHLSACSSKTAWYCPSRFHYSKITLQLSTCTGKRKYTGMYWGNPIRSILLPLVMRK